MFIMQYKVVLTFESVDEILKCDHSNERQRAVLSCDAVYYAVQCGSFKAVDETRSVTIQMNAIEQLNNDSVPYLLGSCDSLVLDHHCAVSKFCVVLVTNSRTNKKNSFP